MKQKIFYYKSQSEIIHLLKQASVGVLASKSEGLPLALLEYGMAGLPVITTSVGKCPELVKSNGQIVSPGKSQELKNALIYYLENQTRRKRDATTFQKKIILEFSWESSLKAIHNYYKIF